MNQPPYILTPDDEQPSSLDLAADGGTPEQPYALAAGLIGLLALLVLRGVLADFRFDHIIYASLVIGVMSYLAMAVTLPKLPLVPMAILAAELGMLYSLPANRVYIIFDPQNVFLTVYQIIMLAVYLVGTGLLGVVLARVLRVKDRPQQVLPIIFLLLFVPLSCWYVLLPR